MNNKKTIFSIILVIVVITGIYFFISSDSVKNEDNTKIPSPPELPN